MEKENVMQGAGLPAMTPPRLTQDLAASGAFTAPTTVTLTLASQTTQGNARTGESEHHSTCTICLSGTVMQVQDAITELFDADRANGLRRELGLNVTSASAASGQQ